MSDKVFIHGLESSEKGTKALFFRERYPDMIIRTFTGSLVERMEVLRGHLKEKSDLIIVGSSFGGLMAALFAMERETAVKRLILLAPAIHLIESATDVVKEISVPVIIYHGTADEVIPLAGVETASRKIFHDLTFHRVEDDHFLHQTFKSIDWDALLS